MFKKEIFFRLAQETYIFVYLERNEGLKMHKVYRDEKTSFSEKLPLFRELLEYLPNLSSLNHQICTSHRYVYHIDI